jgi:FKBP-type peptidyl-prolyl cis-trans isomerase
MLGINKLLVSVFCSIVVVLLISSCQEGRDCTERPDLSGIDEDLLDAKVAEIEEYLDSLGVDYLTDPSGVRIEVLGVGSGNVPNACSSVGVTYTGQVLRESELFDANIGTVFNLGRQNLIRGWLFGLYNMKVEGEYLLYIPSPLGYGADTLKDTSGDILIPANSNLLFRIKVNSLSTN